MDNTYEKKIVKIQSLYRGKLIRKKIEYDHMKELSEFVEKITPELIEIWNEQQLPLFDKLHFETYEEHFMGDKNQEKTKEISPVLYSILKYLMKKENQRLYEDKTNRYDYLYRNIPLEAKITLSQNNTWTGNGTIKKPWHLLFKFNINKKGIIEGCFCMIVNLKDCITNWSKPKDSKKGGRVNFSELKFSNENYDNLIIVRGKAIKCKKWLKYELEEGFTLADGVTFDDA